MKKIEIKIHQDLYGLIEDMAEDLKVKNEEIIISGLFFIFPNKNLKNYKELPKILR